MINLLTIAKTQAVFPGVVPGVMAENDPYGVIMAIMGMGIVFSALLFMYILFSNTPALFKATFRQKLRDKIRSISSRPSPEPSQEMVVQDSAVELSGEVNAAIAAAIYLYRSELHDFEDAVLTIKKVSRTYSPWSSKIYGLRNPLNKK